MNSPVATAAAAPPNLVDVFVAPLPLAAVAVLAFNDHLLKGSGVAPGWLTGKLSDFAGLFFFPLFLTAAASLLLRLRRERDGALVAACALATALAFAAVKTLPAADGAYEALFGALRGVARVDNVRDPTDLLALPMAALAVAYARHRLSIPGRQTGANP